MSQFTVTRLACCLALASSAHAAPLVCPPHAPSGWKVPDGRLESVEVMRYPKEAPREEEDVPASPPDHEQARRGQLLQRWQFSADSRQAIQCRYMCTSRSLRLDASKVQVCHASWRTRADGSQIFGSLNFRCE